MFAPLDISSLARSLARRLLACARAWRPRARPTGGARAKRASSRLSLAGGGSESEPRMRRLTALVDYCNPPSERRTRSTVRRESWRGNSEGRRLAWAREFSRRSRASPECAERGGEKERRKKVPHKCKSGLSLRVIYAANLLALNWEEGEKKAPKASRTTAPK